MADLTITAANVAEGTGAKVAEGTTAEAITAGQTVAFDSNGNLVKCDADAAAPVYRLIGIAINSAPGSGQRLTYVTQGAEVDVGATLTIGETYITGSEDVSRTTSAAGGIAPAADKVTGDHVAVVGVATAADKLSVNITEYSTSEGAVA